MISPSFFGRISWTLPLVFSLAFSACGPDAAPPTPSGSPPASSSKAQTAPSSDALQADLGKAFDGSTATLLELKTPEQFSQIKMNADVTVIPGPDGLALKVTGIDPVFLLPPFAAGKQFVLKVIIDAPIETGMQLFYTLRDAPDYTEAHSQTVPLTKGKNVVYFRVDQPTLLEPVRLDPVYTPGNYKIESIAAREIARPVTQ